MMYVCAVYGIIAAWPPYKDTQSMFSIFCISPCCTVKDSILYIVLLFPITKLQGSASYILWYKKITKRLRLLSGQPDILVLSVNNRLEHIKELRSNVEVAYWPTRQFRVKLRQRYRRITSQYRHFHFTLLHCTSSITKCQQEQQCTHGRRIENESRTVHSTQEHSTQVNGTPRLVLRVVHWRVCSTAHVWIFSHFCVK